MSLLGKLITVIGLGEPLRIGFLRQDCDLGVGGPVRKAAMPGVPATSGYYLIKLSTKEMVREMEEDEDFDKAVLAGRKDP